jgi:hypothetical protein
MPRSARPSPSTSKSKVWSSLSERTGLSGLVSRNRQASVSLSHKTAMGDSTRGPCGFRKTGHRSVKSAFKSRQFATHAMPAIDLWEKKPGTTKGAFVPTHHSTERNAKACARHTGGGSADIDGQSGIDHPKVGSEIAVRLFGDYYKELVLLHSRLLAKKLGATPSKLFWADKHQFSSILNGSICCAPALRGS